MDIRSEKRALKKAMKKLPVSEQVRKLYQAIMAIAVDDVSNNHIEDNSLGLIITTLLDMLIERKQNILARRLDEKSNDILSHSLAKVVTFKAGDFRTNLLEKLLAAGANPFSYYDDINNHGRTTIHKNFYSSAIAQAIEEGTQDARSVGDIDLMLENNLNRPTSEQFYAALYVAVEKDNSALKGKILSHVRDKNRANEFNKIIKARRGHLERLLVKHSDIVVSSIASEWSDRTKELEAAKTDMHDHLFKAL